MPVMDGLQLLQHVKVRDADAAVIMLTGAAGTHFDAGVVATFLAIPLEVFEEARARSVNPPTS